MGQIAGTPARAAAPVYVAARELVAPNLPLPEVLEVALESGADGFELAHEQIPLLADPDDVEDLPPLLARFAERPTLTVLQPLFVAGRLQDELLLATLVQCHALRCSLVAFPLADVNGVTDELLDAAQAAIALAHERAPEVRITVTNDHQPGSADAGRWQGLLERMSRWDVPILMTLDLANWACAGGDIAGAAQMLGQYVAYVRVARSVSREGRCVGEAPRQADDVYPPVRYLPVHAPRATAFGITLPDPPDRERLVVSLSEFVEAIRAGTFEV
jgi:sugar phosphate isomerase/epimerase